MPVFISYQRLDEIAALAAYTTLKTAGIPAYLDVLDPQLEPSAATRTILARLDQCSHLLALVSPTTVTSWWVPFEIGAATKSDRRIATLKSGIVVLPHYLTIWPVLERSQLDLFIQRYLQDAATPETVMLKSYGMRESVTKSIRSAETFHARLKSDLGQR